MAWVIWGNANECVKYLFWLLLFRQIPWLPPNKSPISHFPAAQQLVLNKYLIYPLYKQQVVWNVGENWGIILRRGLNTQHLIKFFQRSKCIILYGGYCNCFSTVVYVFLQSNQGILVKLIDSCLHSHWHFGCLRIHFS